MTRFSIRLTAVAALLHTAIAVAQTASVRDFAPQCSPPFGSGVTVTVAPPTVGTIVPITTRAPRFSGGWVVLSVSANHLGFDLTPFGSPGCRLYPTLDAGLLLPFSLLSATTATHTVPVPHGVPLGTQFFVQAVLTNPGPAGHGILTSNAVHATVGYEPDLTDSQIAAFAPIVRLHPNERYMPMDPMLFIQLSRFRHHRGWQSDQGYNKRTNTWDTTDSHGRDYYDVPVSVVNAYGLNSNGTNRRPRDANSGSSWNVFLQPSGAPTGHSHPSGVVPVFHHYRRSGDVHQIQYWWFFGFNDSLATFNHQGDWEHVTVHVVGGRVVGIYFAAHEGGEYREASRVAFHLGRPVVYVARGSHAAYPTVGTFHYGVDETADGGYAWDTSSLLGRLADQPWRDFAGAWGEVGSIATTTGPLGPWFKRAAP
jgi:hypothetical protein